MIRRLREGPGADARAEQRSATAPQHEQRQHASQRSASWWSILCPYLLLLSRGIIVKSSPMTLTLEKTKFFLQQSPEFRRSLSLSRPFLLRNEPGLWKQRKELPRNRAHLGYQDADALALLQ